MADSTVVSLFNARVHTMREAVALRSGNGDGVWSERTWSDYGSEVRALARGLAARGVGKGDAVAVLSGNRAEYNIADLATLANGAVAVPIYATNSPEQVGYVLEHSGAKAVFVEDDAQLAKVSAVRGQLPDLEVVIGFDTSSDTSSGTFGADETYDALVGAGRLLDEERPADYDDACADVAPGDLAMLIYTSGTTGPPKGAMITHANVVWTARSLAQVLGVDDYRVISFLPMAHIAERMVGHYAMIYFAGQTNFGGGIDTLRDDIASVRPTVFFAVPRVYEKFEAAVRERLGGLSGLRGALVRQAQAVGERIVVARQSGESVGLVERIMHRFLDRLALSKLRAQVGFDQCEFMISGAAPITTGTLEYFHSLGLPVAEVYGQTEGCGPTALNPPGRVRIGSVGPPIPGVDVRLDDGEICVRGGNVFRGYFGNDDATGVTLRDGWLYSGDLGELDEDGYLRITGRKKDLIITAGGKNVSPQNIESALQASPYISQAVVIGDSRKFIAALIALDADALGEWGETAADSGSDAVRELIGGVVADVNETLSNVEQVKKFTILPADLTQEAGELTPTLKVKRDVVTERYAAEIDAMYE